MEDFLFYFIAMKKKPSPMKNNQWIYINSVHCPTGFKVPTILKIHFHISGFRTPISKCTYSYISSTTYIIFIFEKIFFAKFLQRLSNFKSCFRGNPSIRRGQGSGLCSSRGDSISLCLQQNFDEILHSIEMNYLCLMKFAIHFGIRKPMFFCSSFFQKRWILFFHLLQLQRIRWLMQKSSLFTSSTYKAQPFTSFDGRSLLRNINGTFPWRNCLVH